MRNKERCKWREIDMRFVETDCGKIEFKPYEFSINKYKFCHYCGKPIGAILKWKS